MSNQQLWDYLFSKKIAHTRPFDRDFIWIEKADFERIKQFFKRERNALTRSPSFRSNSFFRHVHVIEKGSYFFAHFDFGNHKKFPPLALLHLFRDVLPYFFYCLFKREKFNSYFLAPADNVASGYNQKVNNK